MKKYILDGKEFTTRDRAYKYMARVLGFNEFFGSNLDALEDSLWDLSGSEIDLVRARLVPRNLGDYGLSILDVLADGQKKYDINLNIYW